MRGRGWKYTQIVMITIAVLVIVWYRMPDYQIWSSVAIGGEGHRESMVDVVVYKQWLSSRVYREIEEEFAQVNGKPEKLTLRLFLPVLRNRHGEAPYRTVVFDYENALQYILLE
nr:hypothetical protein [uncultured Blautia sp.]